MNRLSVGRNLIVVTALSTIVGPIAVDGLFLAKAHMANPLWLPHAKLHFIAQAIQFHKVRAVR